MRVQHRGRRIPINRKPRYCPWCGGEMVKNGILRNKQMWKCHDCRRATAYPVRETSK